GRIDAPDDGRTAGEADHHEGGGEREKRENSDGHGVRPFGINPKFHHKTPANPATSSRPGSGTPALARPGLRGYRTLTIPPGSRRTPNYGAGAHLFDHQTRRHPP